MGWVGKCKKCGECCRTDINWIYFEDEAQKKVAVDFSEKRGYKVIQNNKDYLQVQFKSVCPQLENNQCRINKTKPFWCSQYPFQGEDEGLDPSLLVPANCGFKYVKEIIDD